MRDFFNGWRRKAGCVALMMACAFATGWVRSLMVRDVLAWKRIDADQAIRSFEGGVGWQRFSPSSPNTSVGWIADSGRSYFFADPWWTYENFIGAKTARMDWAGFHFGSVEWMASTGPAGQGRFAVWIIPYWSMTIPLTLLSAYLILWKPRKAK